MTRHQPRRFIERCLIGIIAASMVMLLQMPTAGQIPPLLNRDASSIPGTSRSSSTIMRQGTIEYADVMLDGKPLFTVAAPVSAQGPPELDTSGQSNAPSADDSSPASASGLNGASSPTSNRGASSDGALPTLGDVMPVFSSQMLSIKQRVEQIETNLASVLISPIDPDDLRVFAGTFNNQPVIFVSDREGVRSLQIVTITDLDVKLSGKTQSEVVLERITAIRNGLTQALQQRQPRYLQQQAQRAGTLFLIMAVLSLAIAYIQRLLKRQWNWLHQCDRDSQLTLHDKMKDELKGTTSMHEFAALKPLQYLAMRLPHLSYARKRNINLIIRRLLQWFQVSIWLGSAIWALRLFPQTREVGIWLSQIPVRLLAIALVVGFVNKLGDVFIDYSLQIWAEQEAINPTGFHRQACRAPTFSVALKGLLMVLCVVAGLIWALYELRVPITPVLTGAGIVGFALSLSAQSLIKDVINGGLILLEDQYAVGDVIAVGEVLGFVEHMNLRITQLRDPDGELVTIPNGSISTVRNLSNGWSRVNFEIEVSYETDIDRAMEVMEMVIEQMRSEALWGDRIIEPAEILGVDKLSHMGILIRIWIKTRPLQQWNVSREFRRRLKRAFEEHDIPIGVPQQFLWVKNAGELAALEQAARSHHPRDNGKPAPDEPATP